MSDPLVQALETTVRCLTEENDALRDEIQEQKQAVAYWRDRYNALQAEQGGILARLRRFIK